MWQGVTMDNKKLKTTTLKSLFSALTMDFSTVTTVFT